MQKRLNLSICRFDCGLEWAEGCTSSIVFARWRKCALVEAHVAVTCRITLSHPSTAAMRLMANYFDHLLSLDTPTYAVAQIANRFEPSTVLWAFHTMQPSSFRWSIHALVAMIQPDIVVRLCADGDFCVILRPVFSASHVHCSTFQTCILNSH